MLQRENQNWLNFVALAIIVISTACTSPLGMAPTEVASTAQEHFGRGLDGLRRGDDAAARVSFENAVQGEPFFVEAHRRLQNVRLRALERERLYREYRHLVDENPNSAAAHYLFGRIRYRAERQLESFRRARELDPDFFWGHYAEAFALGRLNRAEESAAALARARRIDPKNPLTWRLEAGAQLRKAKKEAARKALRRAVDLEGDPENADLTLEFARLCSTLGHKLELLDTLDRALSIQPGHPGALALLEFLVKKDSDSPEGWLAAAKLQQSIAAMPDPDGPTLMRLARVYEWQGRTRQARVVAEEAFRRGHVTRAMAMSLRKLRRSPLKLAFEAWLKTTGIAPTQDNPRILRLAKALDAYAVAPAAIRASSASAELVSAMSAAGWIKEALMFVEEMGPEVGFGDHPDVAIAVKKLQTHQRFLAELELFVNEERRGKSSERRAEGLEAFIARIVARLNRVTDVDVASGNDILGFVFLGEILDVTRREAGSLNGYLDQFNQIIMAGRWAGEKPQVMLMNLARPPVHALPEDWPDRHGYAEVVGENIIIAPLDNRELGRAFYRTFYLNLDRIQPSKRQREMVMGLPEVTKARLLAARGLDASGAADRQAIDEPFDASLTLLLRALSLHDSLPVEGHVRAHEIGHVRDAATRLPVFANPVNNALLAIESGFNTDRLAGILEETAQLHALRYGPSPHLVLSELIDFISDGTEVTIHHRGYRTLLGRFLATLDEKLKDFPCLNRNHRLIHQLHWLSESKIRAIAHQIPN
ncbi:MAG: hypothetical protein V3W41_21670 [Planctomycetota bacterium]